MGTEETVEAKVWVLCAVCEKKHRVVPGVGAPMYWCENKLMSLKDGDNVEYEDYDFADEALRIAQKRHIEQ